MPVPNEDFPHSEPPEYDPDSDIDPDEAYPDDEYPDDGALDPDWFETIGFGPDGDEVEPLPEPDDFFLDPRDDDFFDPGFGGAA
ncbi:MAG: hypothetical protein AAF589_00490 [Planctomycetota bacterium]